MTGDDGGISPSFREPWPGYTSAPQDSDETRGGRKQGDQMTGDDGGISLPSTSAPQDSKGYQPKIKT